MFYCVYDPVLHLYKNISYVFVQAAYDKLIVWLSMSPVLWWL